MALGAILVFGLAFWFALRPHHDSTTRYYFATKERQKTLDEDDDEDNQQNQKNHTNLTMDDEERPATTVWESFFDPNASLDEQQDPPISLYPMENNTCTDDDEEEEDMSFPRVFHGPNEVCSSPACDVCETRRRQGPTIARFSATDILSNRGSRAPKLPSKGSRNHVAYVVNDTVDL